MRRVQPSCSLSMIGTLRVLGAFALGVVVAVMWMNVQFTGHSSHPHPQQFFKCECPKEAIERERADFLAEKLNQLNLYVEKMNATMTAKEDANRRLGSMEYEMQLLNQTAIDANTKFEKCFHDLLSLRKTHVKDDSADSKLLQETGWKSASRIFREDVVKLLNNVFPADANSGPSTGILLKHRSDFETNSSIQSVFDAAADCTELAVVDISRKHCLAIVENSNELMPYNVFRFRQDDRDLKVEYGNSPKSTTLGDWTFYPRVKNWALKMPNWKKSAESDRLLVDFFSGLDEMTEAISATLKKIQRQNDIIVMSINEGHLDLLLNFILSAKKQSIDISNLFVFGTPEAVRILNALSINAFYHPGLGTFPKNAAGTYGDSTFRKMMWLKVAPIYLIQRLGYNVLFQDADLVWFKDPFPFLRTQKADSLWMDDGARSERYSPIYGNSGFYYLKNNPRTVLFMQNMLISFNIIWNIGSHQEVLTQILNDHISRHAHTVQLLSLEDFPSGVVYHHRKAYFQEILHGSAKPYVFHMCWTKNKDDKIKYLKVSNLWFLSDECTVTSLMTNVHNSTDFTNCVLSGKSAV
jgi:hypothetical protein